MKKEWPMVKREKKNPGKPAHNLTIREPRTNKTADDAFLPSLPFLPTYESHKT